MRKAFSQTVPVFLALLCLAGCNGHDDVPPAIRHVSPNKQAERDGPAAANAAGKKQMPELAQTPELADAARVVFPNSDQGREIKICETNSRMKEPKPICQAVQLKKLLDIGVGGGGTERAYKVYKYSNKARRGGVTEAEMTQAFADSLGIEEPSAANLSKFVYPKIRSKTFGRLAGAAVIAGAAYTLWEVNSSGGIKSSGEMNLSKALQESQEPSKPAAPK